MSEKATPDDITIQKAVKVLSDGGIVAVPTETVYGLAANAADATAVARIFEAKGRPSFNPLICHVASMGMADRYVQSSPLAKRLMEAFWPGPLSLVLPLRPDADLASAVTAGLDTLAVRMPASPLMLELIQATNNALAAPSANASGKISPTTAGDVANSLGERVDMVLDGGPCSVGLESTIVGVDYDAITLLRPGSVTAQMIYERCGIMPSENASTDITAPGQLLSHYAPDAAVTLNVSKRVADSFHIGFGNCQSDYNLSPTADLNEAARKLFNALHAANASGKPITVSPIPETGVGVAVNDRLSRAAADRTAS